jgi:hypothetical protein
MKPMRPAGVLLVLLAACTTGDNGSGRATADTNTQGSPPGTVDVVARGLTFQAPSRIPSGWTTFRFRNESDVTHFMLVERMPEGQGVESQQQQVAPVFQQGLDLLTRGETDAAMQAFGSLPPWFGQIVFTGGAGLTAPGHTSEATVYLEPGTYMLECYVKTGGTFHSYNPDPDTYGMVHEITVTDEPSGAAEPRASVDIDISSTSGIQMQGEPAAGEQTIAVHFADQTAYANFVGHDVHLVRLGDGVDLRAVEKWMDWTQPGGLQVPAPAQFLGGLNEMPAGSTGYFTVTLEPGDYALISEVPGPSEKGLLKRFSVS